MTTNSGDVFGRCLNAIVRGGKKAASYAAGRYGPDDSATKALSTAGMDDGSALLDADASTSAFEAIRPRSVIRRLTNTIVETEAPTFGFPVILTGATARYVDDNDPVVVSSPRFGEFVASSHKLMAEVHYSNDLARFSANFEQVILYDAIAAIAQRENESCLVGDGTEGAIWGLDARVLAANRFNATAGSVTTTVETDLIEAAHRLKAAKLNLSRPTWILSERTELALLTARHDEGVYAFKPEMLSGKLLTYPYIATPDLPDDRGDGHDESVVLLVDAGDLVLVQYPHLTIKWGHAATLNDNGVYFSGFGRDMSSLQVIAYHDLVLRHAESIVAIDKVTWGASA